ncbi:sensor histidine kinase [Lederbergia wuyishanensis]|uniref:Sensor histidine kinase NatK-like C-terminal domain-containing protein n=1 Tax=Lederbergia wuyishanensis TaxID=1347903 RepID=A0ABU0D868_9BACI|nr:GHKL domain-containing protein [Lederbergia wuyishanensis]MCJ8009254.1 GHKL domain-containing protein [Lederbergia wuyishanensis]MDQ0344613.1 hypothetical protein [Lederbergia wuyishanensis]
MNVIHAFFSILKWAIEINTGLLLGFSLVEADLKSIVKKLMPVSLIAGLLYYVFHSYPSLLPVLYFTLIPILFLILKLPLKQIIIGVLLALTFDLSIIKILEYNLLDILLMSSNIEKDTGIKLSLDLFITLNNVLIGYIIFHKTPSLFPKVWFEKNVLGIGNQNLNIFFVIVLLFLVDLGLYYSHTELPFFRLSFRIFLTFWITIICIFIVFFLRTSIVYKLERSQFFLDRQHQEDLLSYYSIIRSQRHDFNIHINTIYSLLNRQDYESSKEYIKYMVADTKYINDLLPLHHPAIGAMLNTFKELAAQKGIQIKYFIYDNLRTMPCSVYEMNKILGNLIQNAIEEVEYEPKEAQMIEVQIAKERDNIVITVTNATDMDDQDLEKIFNSGHTTKKAHEGIGLPTVQNIASKYKGIAYPILNDGKISFIVRIPTSL